MTQVMTWRMRKNKKPEGATKRQVDFSCGTAEATDDNIKTTQLWNSSVVLSNICSCSSCLFKDKRLYLSHFSVFQTLVAEPDNEQHFSRVQQPVSSSDGSVHAETFDQGCMYSETCEGCDTDFSLWYTKSADQQPTFCWTTITKTSVTSLRGIPAVNFKSSVKHQMVSKLSQFLFLLSYCVTLSY